MKWTFLGLYVTLPTLFVAGALVLLSSVSACVGQSDSRPLTTTVIKPVVECRLVETHTIHYIDRPVSAVELVKLVEMPIKLHNFNSLTELKQWVLEVNTTTTTVYLQRPDVTVDCDDFALTLQRKALADGYVMSFQIIASSEYNNLFKNGKISGDALHVINLAVIGNNAYYVEPQTGEVVFAAQLD